MHRLNTHLNISWLCEVDFNELRSEKTSVGFTRYGDSAGFRTVLNQYGLSNLEFSGPKFTWNNKREVGANIQEKVDRIGSDRRVILRKILYTVLLLSFNSIISIG